MRIVLTIKIFNHLLAVSNWTVMLFDEASFHSIQVHSKIHHAIIPAGITGVFVFGCTQRHGFANAGLTHTSEVVVATSIDRIIAIVTTFNNFYCDKQLSPLANCLLGNRIAFPPGF